MIAAGARERRRLRGLDRVGHLSQPFDDSRSVAARRRGRRWRRWFLGWRLGALEGRHGRDLERQGLLKRPMVVCLALPGSPVDLELVGSSSGSPATSTISCPMPASQRLQRTTIFYLRTRSAAPALASASTTPSSAGDCNEASSARGRRRDRPRAGRPQTQNRVSARPRSRRPPRNSTPSSRQGSVAATVNSRTTRPGPRGTCGTAGPGPRPQARRPERSSAGRAAA